MFDTNPSHSAFARPLGHNGLNHWEEHSANEATDGLTKREYLAAKALQGILANGAIENPDAVASDAVFAADALIDALNES